MKLQKKNYLYMKEAIYFSKLDNGLTVFLLPKTDFHETYGIITTNFGSSHTRIQLKNSDIIEYPAGIAHFLEHKLFETSDEEDVMNEFAKFGASANAYTSLRQTSYLFSTTQDVLPSLSLLQSFVREPYFTEESVKREQGIIEQEIEMYQDDADYQLFSGILASLYPDTPLAYDIAGTVDSIHHIKPEDLYDNFKLFYHPSNMILFLIGNFDIEQTWQQIIGYQSAQIENQRVDFTVLPIQKNPIKKHGTSYFEVAIPKLAIGLRGNDHIEATTMQTYRICLQLLFSMLFGLTSRRYQTLYEQGKIDSSFHFQLEVTPDYHYVVLLGDTQEPITLSNIITRAIKNFETDEDVTKEHLELLKKEMYGEFIRKLNDLEATASHFVSFYSEYENSFELPNILETIELSHIKQAGHCFITQCDMTDFTIFPK